MQDLRGLSVIVMPVIDLQIDVPKGTPALFLENEEHEVLLPPMRYRIRGESFTDGVSTVTLEALHPLDLESLIRSSADIFCVSAN